MKKKSFAILILIGLFFTASCSSDEVVEPTLKLSEHTIMMAKNGSETTIEVTSNQTTWNAIPNTEWIELTKSGTTLAVKAHENPSTVARKAEVTIVAGRAVTTLSVEQAGSDVVIVTTPDALEVDQWGGTFKFYIDANTNNWGVVCDGDWLKVTARQSNNEVIIDIDENVTRDGREAKLTFFGDGNKGLTDVLVTQSGVLYHFLPYLGIKASESDIITFEEARHNDLALTNEYIIHRTIAINTKSEAFPTINYMLNNGYLSYAAIYASDPGVLMDPAFDQMLKDEGFVSTIAKVYKKEVLFEGDKFTIKVEVTRNSALFTIIPPQPYASPTLFDTLPFGFLDFSNTGTYEKIYNWEAENGGKQDFHLSDPTRGFYKFNISKPNFEKPTPVQRIYWGMLSDYADACGHLFTNIEYVFYEVRGMYYITKEFEDLMIRFGYINLLGTSTGLYVYGGPDVDYDLAIGVMKYADVNLGRPVLELRFQASSKNTEEAYINTIEQFIMPVIYEHEPTHRNE